MTKDFEELLVGFKKRIELLEKRSITIPDGAITTDMLDDGAVTTEKLASNTAKFRASLDVNQNIGNNFQTEILFDREWYDPGTDYNPANGRYTVPVTGFYLVNAVLLWNVPNVTARYRLHLKKNGTTHLDSTEAFQYATGLSQYPQSRVSDVFYLTAGDYVSVFGHHDAGATKQVYGDVNGDWTHFSMHLLSL